MVTSLQAMSQGTSVHCLGAAVGTKEEPTSVSFEVMWLGTTIHCLDRAAAVEGNTSLAAWATEAEALVVLLKVTGHAMSSSKTVWK